MHIFPSSVHLKGLETMGSLVTMIAPWQLVDLNIFFH